MCDLSYEETATICSLDWLLLTKRPENVRPMIEEVATLANLRAEAVLLAERWIGGKPPANVWLGTTVEDQQRANERIPALLSVPAAVRFLSMEPLLERVDLSQWMGPRPRLEDWDGYGWPPGTNPAPLHWIIIGGESGHGARPFHLEWARDLVTQARAGGAAPFVKQLGARPMVMPPLCRGWVPVRLKDQSGGDPAEWPEDLRVREFPEVRR